MIIERGKFNDWECPMAWRHGESCVGDECPVFRWIPLHVDKPYLDAVTRTMKRVNPVSGKPYTHAKAAKYVAENRAEFGLPTNPTLGFCGLGPKPEVLA